MLRDCIHSGEPQGGLTPRVAGPRVAEPRTRLVTDTAQTPFEYSQWSEVQTACGTVYAGYLTTPHPAVGDPPAKGTVKYAHPRVRLPSKVTDLADGTVSTERDGWIDFLDNKWQEWTLEDDTAYLQRLSDLRTDRDRTIHARSKARDSEGMDVCACSYDGGATTTYSYKYAVEPQNHMPQWKPSGPHAVRCAPRPAIYRPPLRRRRRPLHHHRRRCRRRRRRRRRRQSPRSPRDEFDWRNSIIPSMGDGQTRCSTWLRSSMAASGGHSA